MKSLSLILDSFIHQSLISNLWYLFSDIQRLISNYLVFGKAHLWLEFLSIIPRRASNSLSLPSSVSIIVSSHNVSHFLWCHWTCIRSSSNISKETCFQYSTKKDWFSSTVDYWLSNVHTTGMYEAQSCVTSRCRCQKFSLICSHRKDAFMSLVFEYFNEKWLRQK